MESATACNTVELKFVMITFRLCTGTYISQLLLFYERSYTIFNCLYHLNTVITYNSISVFPTSSNKILLLVSTENAWKLL